MKTVFFLSVVDEAKCTGDKHCQRICPSSAIKVVDGAARVEAARCVACAKCQDVCPHDAIQMVSRTEPLIIKFNTDDADQARINEICAKAHCFPTQKICACTGTDTGEVVAAILGGAKSPEDLVVMTGIGSGCGIYCMGVVFRLFQAAGVEPPDDPRWNFLPISIWDIPENVANKYPEYYLKEDKDSLPVK